MKIQLAKCSRKTTTIVSLGAENLIYFPGWFVCASDVMMSSIIKIGLGASDKFLTTRRLNGLIQQCLSSKEMRRGEGSGALSSYLWTTG